MRHNHTFAAGVGLCHADGQIIGFGAGALEHDAVELVRRDLMDVFPHHLNAVLHEQRRLVHLVVQAETFLRREGAVFLQAPDEFLLEFFRRGHVPEIVVVRQQARHIASSAVAEASASATSASRTTARTILLRLFFFLRLLDRGHFGLRFLVARVDREDDGAGGGYDTGADGQ